MHGAELREGFKDEQIERALQIVFGHIVLPLDIDVEEYYEGLTLVVKGRKRADSRTAFCSGLSERNGATIFEKLRPCRFEFFVDAKGTAATVRYFWAA